MKHAMCCAPSRLTTRAISRSLVSTDGHRLGVYSLEHPESFCDVSQAKGKVLLIPTELINQIKGTRSAITNTLATFEFEGNTIRMTLELFGKFTSITQGVSDSTYYPIGVKSFQICQLKHSRHSV